MITGATPHAYLRARLCNERVASKQRRDRTGALFEKAAAQYIQRGLRRQNAHALPVATSLRRQDSDGRKTVTMLALFHDHG